MTARALPAARPAAVVAQLAATAAVAVSERSITGLAAPYGPVGNSSLGPITLAQGALTWSAPGRVKLLRQHDPDRPVGYATELDDREDGLHATFEVPAGEAGDTALAEASNGVRDGLSVGVALSEESYEELIEKWVDGDTTPTAVTGELLEISSVSIPAFRDARTDGSPADLAAAAGATLTLAVTFTNQEESTPAMTDTAATVAAAAATPPTPPDPGPAAPPAAAQAPAPTQTPAGSLNAASGPQRRRSAIDDAVAAMARALSGTLDAATANVALTAALADIVPDGPGSAGTDALTMPQFLGELWTPRDLRRPWRALFGVSPLTSMKWVGWKWETRPEVDHWAGNKTEIPTGPAKIVPADGEAHRVAGGWDLDRIYVDFDTGFLRAFLEAAVESYAKLSDVELGEFAQDSATDAGTAASLTEAINTLATALIGEGASLSGILMAPDVWAAFLGLGGDQVPWWLKNQGRVAIAGQEVEISDLSIGVGPGLDLGTVVAADRRAVDYRETGPIRVQAVNIPKGGIDLAVFGYHGFILTDERGLAKVTVEPAGEGLMAPLAAPTVEPAESKAAAKK